MVSNYNYVEDRINLTANIYTEGSPKYGIGINCINVNIKGKQKVFAAQEWIIVDSISKQRRDDSCMASYGVFSFDVSEAYFYTLDDVDNYLIIDEYDPKTGAFSGRFEITFFRSKQGNPVSGYPDTLRATNGKFIVVPQK